MIAVLTVADGADGQHHLDIRTAAAQHLYGATQVVGTLVNRELFLTEKGGGALLAVIDYLASLAESTVWRILAGLYITP